MADRAINMPLRVTGIGEVERDFRKVGDAGSKNFATIEKSANGAAREVSEYTARLRRAAEFAKQKIANTPELWKGPAAEQKANRRDAMLGAIDFEKSRIRNGLPDLTREYGKAEAAGGSFGLSLTRITALSAAAGTAIYSLGNFLMDSVGAFAEHEKAVAGFNARLALAGNRSSATGEEIKAMAEQVVAATGQTEQAALDAATTLAKVPGITKEGLESALDASSRLADALGEDVSKTAQQTATVLTALADKDMKALWKATEDVNDELRVHVVRLAEAGKTAEAQKVYIEGLAKAAGNGPGGLTSATDKATDSWTRLKTKLGEAVAPAATTFFNGLSGLLDSFSGKTENAAVKYGSLVALLSNPITIPIAMQRLLGLDGGESLPSGSTGGGGGWGAGGGNKQVSDFMAQQRAAEGATARAQVKALEEKYGANAPKPKATRGSGGGSESRSNAQILADFQRELRTRGVDYLPNAVRTAAQQNALYKQGLTPLDGYTHPSRHQNAQALDFRRATFDENKVREAAIAAGLKGFELVTESGGRKHAEWTGGGKPGDMSDAFRESQRAQEQANERQAAYIQEAARLDAEILRSKMALVGDGAQLAKLQQEQLVVAAAKYNAALDEKVRDGQMDADKARELKFTNAIATALESQALTREEQTRQLQEAFADQVAANDNQRDLLTAQEGLADTAAERKRLALALLELDQQEERARLKTVIAAGELANATEEQVKAAEQARQRLANLPVIEGAQRRGVERQNRTSLEKFIDDTDPKLIGDKANELVTDELMSVRRGINSAITNALGVDDPLISGLLEVLLDQILFRPLAQILQNAQSSGGGGGFGGLLGGLFGAIGGGISGATVSRLAPDVMSNIAANPGIFAAGTPSVPTGRDFYVGENGRELMRYHGGGRLEVVSGPNVHRAANDGGGGVTVIQNNYLPERADPRRTQAGIARANMRSLAVASRKGLAAPGGRP